MSEVTIGHGGPNQLLAGLEHYSYPDILAYRYATDDMKRIWSPEGGALLERFIQLEIMQAQADMGVNIPQANIDDYWWWMPVIDLERMREHEIVTKHDVNARIATFNELAGHQDVGVAMTSRDHTENTEQLQQRLALELVKGKVIAAIAAFANAAATYSELPITGRTHNVAAQITTLGKRFANQGEEMIDGYNALTRHIDSLKLRGVKGAVGTQQDMLDLFEGDEAKVDELDNRLARVLGFSALYNSVGQIYPRTQDLATLQKLSGVVAPLSNFATGVRLMQGGGLMIESKKKRVGSNAMPHKINPSTSERMVAMYHILGGYEAMLRPKAGEQWLEGDVSCSAIRRVAISDSFYAADGAFEAGLQVLKGFGLFESVISKEIDSCLPFLTTTKVLTACIKRGMGREDAHTRIRDHAFNVVTDMRENGLENNDLLERLGNDSEIPMTYEEICQATERPIDLTGRADAQVRRFVEAANEIIAQNSEAAKYKGGDIL